MPLTVDTLQKFRKLFGVLTVFVVAVMLILSLFVAHVLNQSRLRYYANAAETSRNLAISLEHYLHSHFQEVDLAMHRADQEFKLMHQERRYSDEAFSTYLRSLKDRIPQAQAVRGSDAAGRVIYGEGIDLARPQDLTIREFFARAQIERELIFGLPVISRISGEWVLPLVFPLTLPDGRFGGTAYASLNNATLNESFSELKLGAHGVIVLIDDKKRILHRYPSSDDVKLGNVVQVSPAMQQVLDFKRTSASYTAVGVRSGMERTLSMEKIGRYPVFVVVGLASEDFLAPWYKEIRNACGFLVIMIGLAGVLLRGVWFGLQKQYHALHKLVETDQALQGSLQQLTTSESRWRSLTEGLPQMVWTARPDLTINFMSHHWQEFSGVSSEELMQQGDWSRIIHPDDFPPLRAEWQRAYSLGDEARSDCRLRRHDGVWRVFENHALPQRDARGVIIGWVGSSTDVTAVRAAHDALLQAKEEADQAGRAKSEFVANMSHEIRSPMNAVLGMLQLLQQTQMSERQQDYAAKAHAAAAALLGLLNDILDFSKVEAGKLALDPHPFHLDKIWRDLAVILSANVGDKNVEVLFRIDPALPPLVIGDALRLQQILLNLAGNAIKFTESGEVVLTAQLLERTPDVLTVAFAIRDTGIGISEEQCQRIFDGFSQAEASTARRYGGTGLGLAISQRLVRLMGGTLRVRSVLGQGSVFDFTIDFGAGADQPAAPTSISAPRLPVAELMQGLRCLVVDDNQTARTVLSEMAASFGWQVDLAEGGHEALAAVASRMALRQAYDVVFIDWRMPELDGWETSCRIRELAPEGKMPLIVMVTAHDREALAQRHRELEPVLDGFVVKPVTASMLFDAVAEARMEHRAPLEAVAVPSMRRLAGLRLLLVDDNPANQQVAGELLSNDGAQVAVASSGPQAIAAVSRAGALPDLILMDIQMPEMDGYEATTAILNLLGDTAPPIVAMTANAMPADRIAALKGGMVDHVGKPFDLAQLIGVILRHARREGQPLSQSATLAAPAAAATPVVASPAVAAPAVAAAPAESSLNTVAALKRMGGLTSIYLMTLRSFLGETTILAATLQAARDEQDHYAALAPLHTLKGLAGTVGADRLAVLAQAAELSLKTNPSAGAWEQLGLVLDTCPIVFKDIEQVLRQLDPAWPAEQTAG